MWFSNLLANLFFNCGINGNDLYGEPPSRRLRCTALPKAHSRQDGGSPCHGRDALPRVRVLHGGSSISRKVVIQKQNFTHVTNFA